MFKFRKHILLLAGGGLIAVINACIQSYLAIEPTPLLFVILLPYIIFLLLGRNLSFMGYCMLALVSIIAGSRIIPNAITTLNVPSATRQLIAESTVTLTDSKWTGRAYKYAPNNYLTAAHMAYGKTPLNVGDNTLLHVNSFKLESDLIGLSSAIIPAAYPSVSTAQPTVYVKSLMTGFLQELTFLRMKDLNTAIYTAATRSDRIRPGYSGSPAFSIDGTFSGILTAISYDESRLLVHIALPHLPMEEIPVQSFTAFHKANKERLLTAAIQASMSYQVIAQGITSFEELLTTKRSLLLDDTYSIAYLFSRDDASLFIQTLKDLSSAPLALE